MCVADILCYSSTGLSWNLNFSQELFEREVPMVRVLMLALVDVYISSHDIGVYVWCPTSSSKFLVNSFFSILVGKKILLPL